MYNCTCTIYIYIHAYTGSEAYGAEMPPGATAQNAALVDLILDMLFSLWGGSFHDFRRSYYIIWSTNIILFYEVDGLSGFITFHCILKLSV